MEKDRNLYLQENIHTCDCPKINKTNQIKTKRHYINYRNKYFRSRARCFYSSNNFFANLNC
jgi:hypothetical protein